MKREAISHSKMKRLCRRLDLPVYAGVGILECLWHLAAREAPRGNIGKLSDEEIALAIDYRGDEKELVDALVESRWLDSDATERLIVHDWPDHCEDSVHMRIARARQFFVGGRPPKLGRLPSQERAEAETFYKRAHDATDPCARTGESVTTPCVPPLPVPRPSPLPSKSSDLPKDSLLPRGDHAAAAAADPSLFKRNGKLLLRSADKGGVRGNGNGEWPETARAIHKYFPDADEVFVNQIAMLTDQAIADVKNPKVRLSDGLLARAIESTHTRRQRGAGLWLRTVPACIRTWAVEGEYDPEAEAERRREERARRGLY